MKAEALIRSIEDTIIMNKHLSLLDRKKVGVIGFNARPIAASLRRQGAQTFVSDYWSDLDLASASTECITVLSPVPGVRQRQPLDLPLHEALVENFEVLTKNQDLDFVIIGSGFDDHSDSLNDLHRRGLLIGSSPSSMKKARDLESVDKLSSKLGYKVPQREVFQTSQELLESETAKQFPYVLRPLFSGGGAGIRYVRNQDDLQRIIDQRPKESYPLVIQEYIRGRDFSCSILSTGKQAKAVSVQKQLIGMPSAGRNCDFAYCGNYLPSGLPTFLEHKIMWYSEQLAVQLGLTGSIGFDFVVSDSDEVWFLEINPRIQGTLEMLEKAGDISITLEHVNSSRGELIDIIPLFNPVVKMIVYSRRAGVVPDLSMFPDTYDRSPKGVQVNQRDPICTVITTGRNLTDAYRKTCNNVWNIQKHTNVNEH